MIIAEPEDADRKKKTLKSKIKVSKTLHNDSKPNISYPTNFEHTVHVGFDAITGEFTVSTTTCTIAITAAGIVGDGDPLAVFWFHNSFAFVSFVIASDGVHLIEFCALVIVPHQLNFYRSYYR